MKKAAAIAWGLAAILAAGCAGPEPREKGPGYQHALSWPRGERLKEPQGLDVFGGEVYVADAGSCRIEVYSLEGEHLRGWGGCGQGLLGKPVDVAAGPGGLLYVADFLDDRIVAFTPRGEKKASWGGSGQAAGRLSGPVGVDARQGRLYVSEFYNHRLQVFTADGESLALLGAGPEGGLQLHYPTRAALDPGGRVWVSDHMTRLVRFGPSHDVEEVLAPSQGWPGDINDVTALAFDGQGRLHAADSGHRAVKMYSPRGGRLAEWTLPEVEGEHFKSPTGVACDGRGHVYVADIASGRIHKLRIVP